MTLLEATAFIPGVLAGAVGVSELRANINPVEKLRRLIPVGAALTLVVVFFLLERAIDVTSSYMPWLAYSMALVAMIVGVGGALIKYSRRLNSVMIAVAGFTLAYYWAFLSIPRP